MLIIHDNKIGLTYELLSNLAFNVIKHSFVQVKLQAKSIFPNESWGLTVVPSAAATASKLCLSVGWLAQQKIWLQTHCKPIVGVDGPLSSHWFIPLLAHANMSEYIWALRQKPTKYLCMLASMFNIHQYTSSSVTLVLQNIGCTSNTPEKTLPEYSTS